MHATLRRWGFLRPRNFNERIDRIVLKTQWHYMFRGLSWRQILYVLLRYYLTGERMSFLDEELAGLKAASSQNFLMNIATRDDAGLVIGATSLLDQFIALGLIIRFPVEITRSSYERIFGPNAPLGAFSAKITVAHALGMVFGDMWNDLTNLRKIRNVYAHEIMPPPLTQGHLAQRCRALKLKIDLSPDILAACATPERQRVAESTFSLVLHLLVLIQRAVAERKCYSAHSDEINSEMRSLIDEMNKKSENAPSK